MKRLLRLWMLRLILLLLLLRMLLRHVLWCRILLLLRVQRL